MRSRRYTDRDLSRRVDVRIWWESTLQLPLEEGAALLGHWSDFTPLWYLQHIDGRRPDLLALFPPDMDNVIRPWVNMGRPLYQAAPTHGWAPDLPQTYPIDTQRFTSSILDITLVRVPDSLQPGRVTTLQFCWKANRSLPHTTFAAVRFTPLDGGRGFENNERLVPAWYPFDPIPEGTEGLGMVALQIPAGTRAGTYRAELVFFGG